MHYHVLGLNKYSTEDDMEKAYSKLAFRSHPEKNKHSQDSAVMRMINEAKEVLEDILRYNDAMREKEHVRTAQKYIESDEISIYSCAVRTHYCSLIASL